MGALGAVLACPPHVLAAVAAERAALRVDARLEYLEDAALADGVEWGLAVKGTPPRNTSGWSMVDTPLRDHRRELARRRAALRGEPDPFYAEQRAQGRAFRAALRGG